jgi:hypothetical protein
VASGSATSEAQVIFFYLDALLRLLNLEMEKIDKYFDYDIDEIGKDLGVMII